MNLRKLKDSFKWTGTFSKKFWISSRFADNLYSNDTLKMYHKIDVKILALAFFNSSVGTFPQTLLNLRKLKDSFKWTVTFSKKFWISLRFVDNLYSNDILKTYRKIDVKILAQSFFKLRCRTLRANTNEPEQGVRFV